MESPCSSVTVTLRSTVPSDSRSSDAGLTNRPEGPSTTSASTSALRSPLTALMVEVPRGPTEVSSPFSLTVRIEGSLDSNETGSSGMARPSASTTVAVS